MPYEPVTLGLKFEIRLEDLTVRDVVVVTCDACQAKWNVAPHHLLSRYNPLTKMTRIQEDMICKKCTGRTPMYWHIMRAVGPEFPRSA